MQREIGTNVNIGQTVSPFESVGKVPSFDKTASGFDTTPEKVEKLKRFVERGKYVLKLPDTFQEYWN